MPGRFNNRESTNDDGVLLLGVFQEHLSKNHEPFLSFFLLPLLGGVLATTVRVVYLIITADKLVLTESGW